MTAWKKLVSTPASLHRESESYLARGHRGRGRGLRDHEVDNRDDFGETSSLKDWGASRCPDALHHRSDEWTFDDGEGDFWDSPEQEDTFYECEVSPLNEDFDQREHCYQTLEAPEACRAAHKNPKKSLHVRVQVEGAEILALVDTGATSSFVQQGLVKKLGLWNRVQSCQQQVRYGNGDVEPMIGVVTLPVRVQGTHMPMRAYVLHSKGPPLIMGFTFLEDNKLVVDCTEQTLTQKDSGSQVKCLLV